MLDNDLADSVKPGDRVCCTGVYRVLLPSAGRVPGALACHVIAIAMSKCGTSELDLQVDTKELQRIQDFVHAAR